MMQWRVGKTITRTKVRAGSVLACARIGFFGVRSTRRHGIAISILLARRALVPRKKRMVSDRSMRTVVPGTTLLHAKRWAAKAGISEVREITSLDVLGVPVYVSVRPQARAEAFTFGKGLAPLEAEVGAYMEALEFFFAEPETARVATRWGTARDVSGAHRANDAILDFVPRLRRA